MWNHPEAWSFNVGEDYSAEHSEHNAHEIVDRLECCEIGETVEY